MTQVQRAPAVPFAGGRRPIAVAAVQRCRAMSPASSFGSSCRRVVPPDTGVAVCLKLDPQRKIPVGFGLRGALRASLPICPVSFLQMRWLHFVGDHVAWAKSPGARKRVWRSRKNERPRRRASRRWDSVNGPIAAPPSHAASRAHRSVVEDERGRTHGDPDRWRYLRPDVLGAAENSRNELSGSPSRGLPSALRAFRAAFPPAPPHVDLPCSDRIRE